MFLSAQHKTAVVCRQSRTDLLAAEWMVTAHLLVNDVCQPGGSSGLRLSKEKLHTFKSLRCSAAAGGDSAAVPGANCTEKITGPLQATATTTPTGVSSSINPDHSLRPSVSVRLSAAGPPLIHRACSPRVFVRARACAWRAARTATGNETIAPRLGSGEEEGTVGRRGRQGQGHCE